MSSAWNDFWDGVEWFFSPKMWCHTYGLNYVVHYDYYSMMCSSFSKEEEDPRKEEAIGALLEAVAEEVGYPQIDWWFPMDISERKEEMLLDDQYIGEIFVTKETPFA